MVPGGVEIAPERLAQTFCAEPLQFSGPALLPLAARRFGCRRRTPGFRQGTDEREGFGFVLRFQRGPHHAPEQ